MIKYSVWSGSLVVEPIILSDKAGVQFPVGLREQ